MNDWGMCSELLPPGEAVLSARPEVSRLVMAVTVITCGRNWASHLMGGAGRRVPVGGGPRVFRRVLPKRTRRSQPHQPCYRSSLHSFSLLLHRGLPALTPLLTWVSSALNSPIQPHSSSSNDNFKELPQRLSFLVNKMG